MKIETTPPAAAAFKRLADLHEQYALILVAFNAAHRDQKDIIAAVGERIEAAKKADAARITALGRMEADAATSPTAARMAAVERKTLQEREHTPTPEERAAFAQATSDAGVAVAELGKIRCEFQTALDDFNKALAELKRSVIGDQNIELRPRWIEGQTRAFSALGGVH